MVLTFQTKKHDFYRTFNRQDRWSFCRPSANLYNIVPKGDPVPESGYMRPADLLMRSGYSNFKVLEVFSKPLEISVEKEFDKEIRNLEGYECI